MKALTLLMRGGLQGRVSHPRVKGLGLKLQME